MTDTYATRPEATLAALLEATAEGGDCEVRLHQADCGMHPDDDDESRCTCTPDVIEVPAGATVS